jgi:hypothetical protein
MFVLLPSFLLSEDSEEESKKKPRKRAKKGKKPIDASAIERGVKGVAVTE